MAHPNLDVGWGVSSLSLSLVFHPPLSRGGEQKGLVGERQTSHCKAREQTLLLVASLRTVLFMELWPDSRLEIFGKSSSLLFCFAVLTCVPLGVFTSHHTGREGSSGFFSFHHFFHRSFPGLVPGDGEEESYLGSQPTSRGWKIVASSLALGSSRLDICDQERSLRISADGKWEMFTIPMIIMDIDATVSISSWTSQVPHFRPGLAACCCCCCCCICAIFALALLLPPSFGPLASTTPAPDPFG